MTRTLDFFPDWRGSNPFQTMLFSELDRVDAAPAPVRDLAAYLTASAPAGRVLNVHWTTPVLGSATTDEDAVARVSAISAGVQSFRSAGGGVGGAGANVVPPADGRPRQGSQGARVPPAPPHPPRARS